MSRRRKKKRPNKAPTPPKVKVTDGDKAVQTAVQKMRERFDGTTE